MSKKLDLTLDEFKGLFYDPLVMKQHMLNALNSADPDELRAIQIINQVHNRDNHPQKFTETKKMQAEAQELLAAINRSEVQSAQEIERDFNQFLEKYESYSKTVTVNKIYQLLFKISEYKVKFSSFPRKPEKMVQGLNILIGIMSQLNPKEIIIITKDTPRTDKDCIQLLAQIKATLPKNYINQVNLDKLKSTIETKSSSTFLQPLQAITSEHQVQKHSAKKNKNKLAKAKKKAKLMNAGQLDTKQEPLTSQADHQKLQSESTMKIKLKIKPHSRKLRSCLKSKNRKNTRFVQKIKKHVQWADEKIVQSNIINTESDTLSSTTNELLTTGREPVLQDSTSVEEKNNFESSQNGERKFFGQKQFFWRSKPEQLEQPTRNAVTREVKMSEKIRRVFRPNGEIVEEIEREVILSERKEIDNQIPQATHQASFLPSSALEYQSPPEQFPQLYLEPVIIMTKFGITSSRMTTYLGSLQAETKELIQLMLREQPDNDQSFEQWSNYVYSRNNYAKYLAEIKFDSTEVDYNCPINPVTVEKILWDNWRLHKAFEKLFENRKGIGERIIVNHENLEIFHKIMPSQYMIDLAEAYVATPYFPDQKHHLDTIPHNQRYPQLELKNPTTNSDNTTTLTPIKTGSVPSTLWKSEKNKKASKPEQDSTCSFTF